MPRQILYVFTAIIFFLIVPTAFVSAQNAGDTIFVQTFTWDDPSPVGFSAPYRGSFQFPDTSEKFEKILMYYTLKCDPKTNQDNFDCGEWDYTTKTFVVDSSGIMDSTARTNPNYQLLGGGTPDSFAYSINPTWTYFQNIQQSVSYTDTISLVNGTIGTGAQAATYPFSTEALIGRAQFTWKAAELTGAGISAGDISGIKLDVSSLGDEVRNLKIRIKHTALDSLTSDNFEESGFTEVYHLNTSFNATGWQDLNFYQPFNWDGTSNLAVEFTYENLNTGTSSMVNADQSGFGSGIHTAGNDYYLDFNGSSDIVDLGTGPQISGTNPRTIEAWAYTEAFNGGGIFQAGPTGTNGADFSLRTMGSNNLWRMQLWGAPDFDVTLPGSLNNWHHFCVTFDGTTVRLYYDGQLMSSHTGGVNTGNSRFWLGRWSGSRFNGSIDEVRVWDKALDQNTISQWMNRSLDNSHPDYANLVAYYPIDEGNGLNTSDASGNGYDGALQGPPAWQRYSAESYTRNMQATSVRPNAVFEQGVFTSSVSNIVSVDSFQNAPTQVVIYGNPSGQYIIPDDSPNHPSIATDTLVIWEAGDYSYTYDQNGSVLDSSFVNPDVTLYRNDHRYFSNIVRYEIGRYITPYGINLDLGVDGTRWVFDVTDYAPLFHDWVYIQAGNNQELLDLQFVMIKGTPARTVRKVENLWNGNFSYAALFNDTRGEPITKYLDPDGAMWKIKTRTSGHGFGGNNTDNCAEFCPRDHWLNINGNTEFLWELWNECGDNFVYPQGGTWVYDRAGWCPGAIVTTYDHELSPLVNPGDSVVIDYGVEDPAPFNVGGNYELYSQLITYGPPNYNLEASIEEILSPSDDKRFSRRNPICANPKIRIRNNGATRLTKLFITYGVKDGFSPCYYSWEGNLGFMESEEVELPLFNWTALDPQDPRFFVSISAPNDGTDENTQNDYMEVPFELTPQFVNGMYLEVRTNGAARENSYTITDADGNVVVERDNLSNYTVYRDTLDLANGCYIFHFLDDNFFNDFDGNDGISWWANNDGIGYVRWHNANGSVMKTYNPDFGSDIYEQFTVGYIIGQTFEGVICDANTAIEQPYEPGLLNIYPNPTTGNLNIDIELARRENIQIQIYSTVGRLVYESSHRDILSEKIPVRLNVANGVYMVRISSASGVFTRAIQITD